MMFINGRFEVSKVPCIFTSVGCVLPGSDASPHASFTSCVAPRSFDAATLSIKLTWYNTRSHRPRLHSVSPPLLRIKAVEILGTLFGRQAQQQQQSSKVQLSQCWLTCSLRCLHLREDFRFLAVVLCSRDHSLVEHGFELRERFQRVLPRSGRREAGPGEDQAWRHPTKAALDVRVPGVKLVQRSLNLAGDGRTFS